MVVETEEESKVWGYRGVVDGTSHTLTALEQLRSLNMSS